MSTSLGLWTRLPNTHKLQTLSSDSSPDPEMFPCNSRLNFLIYLFFPSGSQKDTGFTSDFLKCITSGPFLDPEKQNLRLNMIPRWLGPMSICLGAFAEKRARDPVETPCFIGHHSVLTSTSGLLLSNKN